MAASGKKNMFNEATRVQMPAMVHLTRLGYTYFGKITEDMAGTVYDPDTNILINVFKEQFARLNPTHAGEAEQTLKIIRQEYGSPGGYDGEVIETMEDLFILALFEIYTNCVL